MLATKRARVIVETLREQPGLKPEYKYDEHQDLPLMAIAAVIGRSFNFGRGWLLIERNREDPSNSITHPHQAINRVDYRSSNRDVLEQVHSRCGHQGGACSNVSKSHA